MRQRKPHRKQITDLSDDQKLALLTEHAFHEAWTSLDDKMFCMHCDAEITGRSGRSVRVYATPDFPDGFQLECGTDDCDGSPLNWAKIPWWREE